MWPNQSMKRIASGPLATAAVLAIFSAASAQDMSVAQLLARPGHFDHKRVSVVGYYVIANEESCLFTTRDAAKRADFEKSIWVEFANSSDLTRIANRRMRLVGTFHYMRDADPRRMRGYGQWSLFACQLDNVTSFKPTE